MLHLIIITKLDVRLNAGKLTCCNNNYIHKRIAKTNNRPR